MNKELLKIAIINCYQGEKEIDNGESRSDWDHRDFTEEEKSEIADEIIDEYEQLFYRYRKEKLENLNNISI